MTNKNQEAFEQMQRLTKQAKKFYGLNYNPGSLYPPKDTKFFLNEEYIPFDFDTDYDDPLYKKYRRVRMLDNPFEDNQTQTQNSAPKQNLKGFDQDDDNNQTNSANFSFSKSWPSSFAQKGGKPNNDDNLINRFVEHAKDPDIEGYVDYPYCDTKAKVTGGIGTLIPNANFMQKFTLTSQKAPVSSLNPAWSSEQINTLYNKMDNFCKNYKIGVDEDGNDVYKVDPADQQRDPYQNMYQEELPYFQDAQLEAESKKYVRQSVLPVIRRNLSKIGLNFDTDFNDDGKIALMDMQYNLGENKFKFIRLNDRDDILNSNLSDATKVSLITNPNAYYSDKNIMAEVLDKGYWPGFTKALINKDAVELAKQSHRKGIQDARNKWTYNTLLNAFNK